MRKGIGTMREELDMKIADKLRSRKEEKKLKNVVLKKGKIKGRENIQKEERNSVTQNDLKNDKKINKKIEKGRGRGKETKNKKRERKNVQEAIDAKKDHALVIRNKRKNKMNATAIAGETADRTNTNDGENKPISGSTAHPKAMTAMAQTTHKKWTD